MRIDRLVSIIMILLEKGRIGAKELSELFEVSPRTIYRDVDTINMAGIPIRSTSGVGGGFEIMEKYKVDKKVFSNSDLSAILTGLSSLSGVIRSDESTGALAKIRSLLPDDKARDIELSANRIYIDLSPWNGNKNIQQYLEIIKTALRENRLLSFDYLDRHGEKTARIAEPYRLVLKNSHWYWQGFCRTRNDFRLFKLSRMTNLQISNEEFALRECAAPQLDFGDNTAALRTEIKIRIHKSVMDRALDYCAFERFTPDGDEHFIVSFPFVENDFYYDILLGLGDKCECLEPPRIREEMRRRVLKIAAIYGE